MKAVTATVLGLTLALGGFTPASANVELGASCEKKNQVSAAGSKAVKCVAKKGKLTWANYSPKATNKDPVPLGANYKFGIWRLRVTAVTDGVDAYVCSENMFNEGCTTDDNYDGVPEADTGKRWVQIDMVMQNTSKKDEAPYLAEIGFLHKGRVYWSGYFQPSTALNPNSISLVSGGSSEVTYFIYLDSSVPANIVAIKGDLFTNKAYYYKAN